jgi:hypothetical protein
MIARLLAALLACLAVALPARGDTQMQTFASAWTIAPWDQFGTVSAASWQYLTYQPWDSSLGTLEEVQVSTSITGTRALASDDVAIRYSFFTGWSPADYQFQDELLIPAGELGFSAMREFSFSSPEGLANWLTYDYLPDAFYYFESRTTEGAHTISASTSLTYVYSATAPIPEPETYAMLLAGLALLGFARRRARG